MRDNSQSDLRWAARSQPTPRLGVPSVPALPSGQKKRGRCRGGEGSRDRISRAGRSASQLACVGRGRRPILHTLPTFPRRSCRGSWLPEYRSRFRGGQKTGSRLSEASPPAWTGDPQRRSDWPAAGGVAHVVRARATEGRRVAFDRDRKKPALAGGGACVRRGGCEGVVALASCR